MAEVGVIGGGPAGVSAAVQLAREGFRVRLFEQREIGGLVANANLVENYPGFPEGLPGPELAERLERHLRRWVRDVRRERVLRVEPSPSGFLVATEAGTHAFKVVVAAPGTVPKEWDVPLPEGVEAHTEVRQLKGVRGARVAVIGAGDAAFDYSLTLAQWGNRVVILGRSPTPRCLRLLRERVQAEPLVDFWPLSKVREVAPGPRLEVEREGKPLTLDVDFLLLAIGRRPNLSFLSPELLKGSFRLFHLIGDAARGGLGQVAMAVGDGLRAAMSIAEVLRDEGSK